MIKGPQEEQAAVPNIPSNVIDHKSNSDASGGCWQRTESNFIASGQYDRLADQTDFAPKLISCFPEDWGMGLGARQLALP